MPDNFKYVGKFKNNLYVEPFQLRSKRDSQNSNFPVKNLRGVKDHGRAWLLDKRAQSFKIYSRRPMLNQLLHKMTSGHASPNQLSAVTFKHKILGVNASAHNYSFAMDRTQHYDGERSKMEISFRSGNRKSSGSRTVKHLNCSTSQTRSVRPATSKNALSPMPMLLTELERTIDKKNSGLEKMQIQVNEITRVWSKAQITNRNTLLATANSNYSTLQKERAFEVKKRQTIFSTLERPTDDLQDVRNESTVKLEESTMHIEPQNLND